MVNRSGFLRVKAHTQIAVEMMMVALTTRTEHPNTSADTALWDFIVKHDPKMAKEAVKKALSEGHSISDEVKKSVE